MARTTTKRTASQIIASQRLVPIVSTVRQQRTVETISVTLAWPDDRLWPNTMTRNRYALARLRSEQRTAAAWATVDALRGAAFVKHKKGARYAVHITAHSPTKRTRDDDNLLAALKSARDGVADMLGVNDKHWDAGTVTWDAPTPRGGIVYTVSLIAV